MPRIHVSQRVLLLEAFAIGLLFTSPTAKAGGFAIMEQSTSGLGSAFAGIAAGSDLSSIFWNPAAVSVAKGLEAEAGGSLILPDTHISGTATFEPAASLVPLPGLGSSVPLSFLDSNGGELAKDALVPAMYAGVPLNDRLSVGFGFNGPFGLVTKPDNDNWAGQFEARTSRLRTYNFNPVASYRITPNLVVGAGAQVEYAKATLKSAFPNVAALVPPNPALNPNLLRPDLANILFGGANPNVVIDGDDFGVGYTLGILWNPLSGTDIGLGFRSSVEHTLDGGLSVAQMPALGRVKISTDLETPDIATASVRQRVSERVTLLGTVEWTNWSDANQVVVEARSNNPNFNAVAGKPVQVLPLHWHDGWFFSGGAEFQMNDSTTLRAGVAYEESPIQNATERTARDPDTNRVWLSLGAGYNWSATTTINLAYSHVFFEDGSIDRTTEFEGLGDIRLLGEAETDVDILSVSVKIKFGTTPAAVPLK
jgi:long-chain fatty acid transport protein